jgi:hypothetical protein
MIMTESFLADEVERQKFFAYDQQQLFDAFVEK